MTIYFWGYLLLGASCAFFVLRADLRRRNLRVNAAAIVAGTALAGVAAAGFYGLVTRGFDSLPWFFDLTAWFVASIAGFMILLLLARAYRVPALILLDAAAPAAAIGFSANRLAWILSAAGGAFVPADAYEFLAGLLIFGFVWREGRAAAQWQRPNGIVTGEYLVLTGAMWGALPWVVGVGDRVAGIISIIAGAAVIAVVLPRYLRVYEGRRVLEHQAVLGEGVQAEYTAPTRECPHPERWKMYDSMTAEVEVLDFLKSLITTVKPSLVVETGTFAGLSTVAIAEGLRQNGFGKVVTCELDPEIFARAKERIDASGLGRWVEYRNESSLEMQVAGEIDLLFSDSEQTIREQEVRRFLPQMNPHGLILIHDANSHAKIVREAALRLAAEGLISVVLLPTPRGLVIAQKRTSN